MAYPIAPGTPAPSVDGVDFAAGPTVLWFYKVTCPVCQMAAPKANTLASAYPAVPLYAVGQDPPERLRDFGSAFGLEPEGLPDHPPYEVSDAYGIRVVPTLFVIEPGGQVSDVVESWDREGYNRVSRGLAERLGVPYVPISEAGDGLPPFRPG
jgi:peroxiredoxin